MGLKGDLGFDDVGSGKYVPCSICLEAVTDNGDRSWAKLQCGHQFHLDCIGSAFNVKGTMQCPNCRKVEKGQWLYANGCRSGPELSVDEWTHDEDPYDISYSEISFGVHWCPFGQLARFPSLLEDGDFPSAAYHDVPGQHVAFADHTAITSASQPCPYVAYFGPMNHPSTSSTSGSVIDATFGNSWNGPGAEIGFTFPSMDHFHSWDHHPRHFSTNGSRAGGASDQSLGPNIVPISSRSNADMPRSGSFAHPILVDQSHSSGLRSASSAASVVAPPYPGSNARARDRVQALEAYYQPHQPGMVSGMRRSSGGHRGMAAASVELDNGLYFVPTGSSLGHTFQEPEDPVSARVHAWERDHLPLLSLNQTDRDHPGGGSFHPSAPGRSDHHTRPMSFRQRHGSERSSSYSWL
ncbi:hypothetical protein SAY87_004419 [Trapa incisa]|uniref:RING-type domain-containing protein n=1 Tax=Trapa incisa TaxID=236973 RepID=A0AAN7JPP1_9MYRT|nr:hypothetical protein SAY87_004419 [Trapa incisa]